MHYFDQLARQLLTFSSPYSSPCPYYFIIIWSACSLCSQSSPKLVRERGLRADRHRPRTTISQVVHPPLYRPLVYVPAETHRDTICMYVRIQSAFILVCIRNTRVRNSNNSNTARSPARPVPGGRQLPDGKTPALPFLVDRSVDPFREEFTACLFLLFALHSAMLKMRVGRLLRWSSPFVYIRAPGYARA